MANHHVALVIDNDDEVLQELKNMLASLGHQCHCARTQEEAERFLEKQGFCYLLLDLELPVRPNQIPKIQVGFNLLERVRERFSEEQLPIIIMTAHGEGHEYPVRAFKMGADDYIKKPFDNERQPLEDKIREAMHKTCEKAHNACPNVGTSKGSTHKLVVPAKRKGTQSWAYRTQHKLHFNGECRKRRYLIRIDDKEAWVRLGTFECLWKLAVQLCNNAPGWIHHSDLHDNAHSAIYRLKKDLSPTLGADGRYIENDGHGSFRLSVPPENITFDEKSLKAGHPVLFEKHAPKRRR